MRRLIKKIHMYAGLLTFTAFTVYGIAGLHATFASDTPRRTCEETSASGASSSGSAAARCANGRRSPPRSRGV